MTILRFYHQKRFIAAVSEIASSNVSIVVIDDISIPANTRIN